MEYSLELILVVILCISNIVLLILFLQSRLSYSILLKKSLKEEKKKNELVEKVSFDSVQTTDEHELAVLRELQKCMENDKVYLNSSLTIQDLAKQVGTNKTTLSHVINTCLGQNFAALLNGYRVQEAIRLLTDRQYVAYNMETIGEMCGYSNRQVFHAAFKKEMGVTPTHFRKISINSQKGNKN